MGRRNDADIWLEYFVAGLKNVWLKVEVLAELGKKCTWGSCAMYCLFYCQIHQQVRRNVSSIIFHDNNIYILLITFIQYKTKQESHNVEYEWRYYFSLIWLGMFWRWRHKDQVLILLHQTIRNFSITLVYRCCSCDRAFTGGNFLERICTKLVIINTKMQARTFRPSD